MQAVWMLLAAVNERGHQKGWSRMQWHLRLSTSAIVATALRVMRLNGAWNTA
jgi:hypothetical protein